MFGNGVAPAPLAMLCHLMLRTFDPFVPLVQAQEPGTECLETLWPLHHGNVLPCCVAAFHPLVPLVQAKLSPLVQAEELGTTLRDAATRVFSNASGSYSSNVNLAVENSSWSDEQQLQEMYMNRKSFAFNSDRWAGAQQDLLGSCHM